MLRENDLPTLADAGIKGERRMAVGHSARQTHDAFLTAQIGNQPLKIDGIRFEQKRASDIRIF